VVAQGRNDLIEVLAELRIDALHVANSTIGLSSLYLLRLVPHGDPSG
jgi:hypothetical protein